MRNLLVLMFSVGFLVLLSQNTMASCQCKCVNGQMAPLCDNSLELRPICPTTVCPMAPPSIQPISSIIVPPIGTQSCSQKQVYNQYTNQYEWKNICYSYARNTNSYTEADETKKAASIYAIQDEPVNTDAADNTKAALQALSNFSAARKQAKIDNYNNQMRQQFLDMMEGKKLQQQQNAQLLTQTQPVAAANQQAGARYCVHCGKQNSRSGGFCAFCGQKIK